MKNKNIFLKIILGSGVLTSIFVVIIIICALMIFDFFTPNTSNTQNIISILNGNSKYADKYLEVSNNNIKNGYVSLARLVYFYQEDTNLSFDNLYKINQNTETKTMRTFTDVCSDNLVTNLNSCKKEDTNIFGIPTQKFNFPLDTTNYFVTSFFNEERVVYGKKNVHNGWDFSVPAKTPVYSICDGYVTKVKYTQDNNSVYDISKNKTGNYITIECIDYSELYYVTFHHLYPNTAKVKVGDRVSHWQQIASVGTTGYSTGNHLHYGLKDANGNLLDGMLFVDMNLKK